MKRGIITLASLLLIVNHINVGFHYIFGELFSAALGDQRPCFEALSGYFCTFVTKLFNIFISSNTELNAL